MVATRSKTRALTGPNSDTEMDEGPQILALTQPVDPDLPDIPSTLQLLPTDHFKPVYPESNRQPIQCPTTKFRQIIDSLPSAVHIANVDFTFQQQINYPSETEIAILQEKIGHTKS
jgi:hypothetical protein